jgi:hypothetical protein
MLESLARVYSSGSERMIGHLDFTAGPAILAALVAAALFPAVLALLSRLPRLRARNALQFLATSVTIVVLWVIALCVPGLRASSAAELATSFMMLASALIIYLEIWALLSRGYTLGLLLTLFRGKAPMSDAQLAASYRQGEGVGWIMRHRLGGLLSARLVRRQGDRVVLTGAGALIGILYRAAVATLGLKVTG